MAKQIMADTVITLPAVQEKKDAPANAGKMSKKGNSALPEGTTVYPACVNIFTVSARL